MMPSEAHALAALRLMLDGVDPAPRDAVLLGESAAVARLARDNVLLLRMPAALRARGLEVPGALAGLASAEDGRVSRTMSFIARVNDLFEADGRPFLFTKSFQHYPDMGRDIDLFVPGPAAETDALIAQSFPGSFERVDLGTRFAGKSTFQARDCPSPLEVHHGREGDVGEHRLFPRLVVARRRRAVFGELRTWVPSPEDQLLLQAIQRIYNHYHIRLADVLRTAAIVRGRPDWETVLETSDRIGIRGGLGCYLHYIDQVHRRASGAPLLPPGLRDRLAPGPWGDVRWGPGHYRFPAHRVLPSLYASKLAHEARQGEWDSVLRLSMLPAFALLTGLRRVAGRLGPAPRPPDTMT